MRHQSLLVFLGFNSFVHCEVQAFAGNLVLGHEAVQSSDSANLGDAQHAVDGNRDPDYKSGSCSHTAADQDNAWWRVDLGVVYKIVKVAITNRVDCCGERLIGAEIHIGNSLYSNGNENQLAATIGPAQCRGTEIFQFEAIEGRYVNIFLPGTNKTLSLCEVEVFADEDGMCWPSYFQKSVAEGATTVQSSTFDGLGNYQNGSCTQTTTENNPWWRVDLGNVYNVGLVTVTNHGDFYQDKLVGAEIRIGNCLDDNGNSNQLAATIMSVPSNGLEMFRFMPVKGRYINIFLPGDNKMLAFCNVEVFPELQTLPLSTCVPASDNLAFGAIAVQSSLYDNIGSPLKAVDGNKTTSYYMGSCTHTQMTDNPWWRVDLGGVYSISRVTITNRGDCCSQLIEGAEIHIGNCLSNNGNGNQLAATIGNITSGATETYSFDPVDGQFVNIFLPGTGKILTLCEVEVFAFIQ
ncbi:uncharacterized protein LOC127421437 [Myxocyprinus asiaticus]|uniref:uncharacterized protein LOC127421437 n=1 Tax=Myxocyprinus asiaticus TaxID=70543 RepID=UPI002223B089|nr:uncharacterized protein LOC127421437 [Myxocyprinus asiaticus]